MTRSQARNMEGATARWYAKQRGSAPQVAAVRESAARLAGELPEGAAVLEVAPGPGYHAVELAKLGLAVTGLDLSRTFVDLASEYARQAGVTAEFRQGDAAGLPFEANSFDLIVCQAAFKNFGQPDRVLAEMHRVLRDGGTAVIQDMNHGATNDDITREVRGMGIGWFNRALTTMALHGLRRRAYSRAEFERLAAASPFGGADCTADGITLEVRLVKP